MLGAVPAGEPRERGDGRGGCGAHGGLCGALGGHSAGSLPGTARWVSRGTVRDMARVTEVFRFAGMLQGWVAASAVNHRSLGFPSQRDRGKFE